MIKLVYKVLSILFGFGGGMVAAQLTKRAWRLAAGEDEAPKADDASRGWREILLAAALQGAIAAAVRAAVKRSAAAGTRRLTGTWPGENSARTASGS